MSNPRYQNGALRRKHRARLKAIGGPCGICGGKLGPIHYDEPSDARHPLSFVVDEIRPISKYKLFGYESREDAANDWNNLQPAHWCCNAAKGNKIGFDFEKYLSGQIGVPVNRSKSFGPVAQDGEW